MTQILLRRGTADVAASSNPVLADGEPGWEKDTRILKVGDGVTPWNELEPIGAGAVSLLELEDVDIVDVEDQQVLTYDAVEEVWTPQTPPAPPQPFLNALQDVDVTTVPPEDGHILIYDAATGKWRPGTGEQQVGAWENDQSVTFSAGSTLFVAPASVLASGTSYPAAPDARIMITEPMLASASRSDVGFVNQLQLTLLTDATTLTGGTSGNMFAQAVYLGETSQVSISMNTTTQARGSFTFCVRDPKVGDVVDIRFRYNAVGHAGVKLSAYVATCYPQSLFNVTPPEGGNYLYQSLSTGPMLGLPGIPETHPATPALQNYKLYDGADLPLTSTNSPPEFHRARWLGYAPNGIYNTYQLHDLIVRLYGMSLAAPSTSPWSIPHMRCPSTVQFDRIVLPSPPA